MSEDTMTVEPDEYSGPATLTLPDRDLPVAVTLHSHFEPIDGHLHWAGRIAVDEAVTTHASPGQTVRLVIGGASAEGRLSDPDPWGRFRITGVGRPPIPTPEA